MPDPAHRTSVVIVSPALADANNGNWQTARRWQHMLSPHFAVRIVRQWPDAAASDQDRVMLAQRLVVLQERGPDALPTALQSKTRVIFQSIGARQTLAKSPPFVRAVMVGHLREENRRKPCLLPPGCSRTTTRCSSTTSAMRWTPAWARKPAPPPPPVRREIEKSGSEIGVRLQLN